MDRPLRIAVIGSGISGMMTAALLHRRHEVTVLEANGYIGGHTHTVSVNLDGERHVIDTGFIVFNEKTYPNFTRLLNLLGVASRPTSMSFSVRCSRSGLEYNGTSLNGLFAQRRNLLRPAFHRMIADILRFNREAPRLLEDLDHEMRVDEFLCRYGYSRQFAEHYLLPMGAAIWSCPVKTFGAFPVRFIIEFYANHGLLQVRDRPVWRVVEGGSHRYVEKLTAPFQDRIQLHCSVGSVRRTADGVLVESRRGSELYDEVVFSCHSDQALRLLADADETERSLLGEFPYSRNRAVLHTDTSLLPRRPRAWASWNYHIPPAAADRPTVTYYMNLLQGLRSQHTFCVTLNEEQAIDPSKVLGAWNYSHPVFTTRRAAAQQRHGEVIRRHRTSFCGAYWGNGFHEDGVNSALRVCEAFGVDRRNWELAMSSLSSRVQPSLSVRAQELGHAG